MRRVLLLSVLIGSSFAVYADEPGVDRIYRLRCASCHGSMGEKDSMSPVPINTLTAQQIEARLRQARDEEVKGSIDRAKATLTEEQAAAVAQHISTTLKEQAQQEEN